MTPLKKAQAHQRLLEYRQRDNENVEDLIANLNRLFKAAHVTEDHMKQSFLTRADPIRGKVEDLSKQLTALQINWVETKEAMTKIASKLDDDGDRRPYEVKDDYGPRREISEGLRAARNSISMAAEPRETRQESNAPSTRTQPAILAPRKTVTIERHDHDATKEHLRIEARKPAPIGLVQGIPELDIQDLMHDTKVPISLAHLLY
ncbi:hypothetical protein BGZ68_001563 [Mortierella alpina]|nr:hypothetical protein BGZ68_001563 [Mortierella alpina]